MDSNVTGTSSHCPSHPAGSPAALRSPARATAAPGALPRHPRCAVGARSCGRGVSGMTTVVLVGLAAVLVLLAAGIVLARRFQRLRPPTAVRPLRSRTVGDLVRERYGSTVGAILMSDHPEPSTAATAPLFTPPTPFRRGQAAEP